MTSLAQNTVIKLEEWWHVFLGSQGISFGDKQLHIVTHPGLPNLGNWDGIYVIVRHGSVILSVPESRRTSILQLFQNRQDVHQIIGALSRRSAIIGPAFIGYRDKELKIGTSPNLATVDMDDPRIAEFRATLSAVEWNEAGISEREEVLLALGEGNRIFALAGYERFERSDSPIAHMSVVVHPDMRNRGFARTAVSGLVNLILKKGLLPQYRALQSNVESMSLARALDFEHFADQYAVKNIAD